METRDGDGDVYYYSLLTGARSWAAPPGGFQPEVPGDGVENSADYTLNTSSAASATGSATAASVGGGESGAGVSALRVRRRQQAEATGGSGGGGSWSLGADASGVDSETTGSDEDEATLHQVRLVVHAANMESTQHKWLQLPRIVVQCSRWRPASGSSSRTRRATRTTVRLPQLSLSSDSRYKPFDTYSHPKPSRYDFRCGRR